MLDGPKLKPEHAAGYFLIVAGGRGLGQIRRIADVALDTVELHHPLRVLPDETSIVLVARINYQNLILDNDQGRPGGKASVNVTLYYAAHENIIAGNYFHSGNGGIRIGGGEWPGRPEPVWPKERQAFTAYPGYFNYVLDNRLEDTAGIGVDGATQEDVGRAPTTMSVLGAVVRGNRLRRTIGPGISAGTGASPALAGQNAKKVTAGIIVEGNSLDTVYGAITIGQRTQHAVVRRNSVSMPPDASAQHVRGIAVSPTASPVTVADNQFDGIPAPLQMVQEPLFPDAVIIIDGETPSCPLKPTQQRGIEVVHWFDSDDKVEGRACVVLEVRGTLQETDKGRGVGKAINIERRDIRVRGGDALRFRWSYKADVPVTCAFSFHGVGDTTRVGQPGQITRNIRFSSRNFGGPQLECPATDGLWQTAEQLLDVPKAADTMGLTIMVPHATTLRFDDLRIARVE